MVNPKLSWCMIALIAMASTSMAQQSSIFLADPTIFKGDEGYYLYGTGSSQGFPVYRSSDLVHWKADSLALKKGNSFGTHGFWAPQVILYKGVYYMAYTANEQIAIAKAGSPAGPFRQDSSYAISGTGKQIDPFLFFDDDGKVYLYHVRLQQGNRIFVAEMKPDLSDIIPGTAKECIAGTAPWENTAHTDWPVTEGPTLLKHKGIYYLIYSANDYRSKDYAVGYATATSPMGPWKKYQGNPIISRHTTGYDGTGHGDLFMVQKQLYYVLHVHHTKGRATGIVKVRFKKGTLVADTTLTLLSDWTNF